MDPGAAFEADGHLDAEEQLRRHGGIRSARAVRQGEANAIAATGGFDKRLAETEVGEDSPMLGDSHRAVDDGDGDDDDKSFVDREFQSLPWYKTPSVGHVRRCSMPRLTMVVLVDILAPPLLRSHCHGIRRRHGTQDQHDSPPDM